MYIDLWIYGSMHVFTIYLLGSCNNNNMCTKYTYGMYKRLFTDVSDSSDSKIHSRSKVTYN